MLCLCTGHLDKLGEICKLNSSSWSHIFLFFNEAPQPYALIFHWVWGNSSLLAVNRSPMFSQCAVPLVIPVKLELVMVWRGGRVTEKGAKLLKLCTQKLIFDSRCSNPSEVFRLPEPHLSTEVQPAIPDSRVCFKCLLPDTIHHLPASCIFADIVTENWCHAIMWEILHLINSFVTPFNKNVPSLMFLEATAEFPAVWSMAWGSLRARGAQCGIEAVISVHCVVGERQRRVGYLWIYSGAVGIHKGIGV